LVNENHKSDQILTHHPSSQNHIIKLERLNQKSNERNFDPTNHHKIPKHDYLKNEMEIMKFYHQIHLKPFNPSKSLS